jgi:hypothetical protein
VKYVYPQKPGPVVRGIPTVHSVEPILILVQSGGELYVWHDENGTARGDKIEPLYPTVPKAVRSDPGFYEFRALVDAIRVGRVRGHEIAVHELQKRVLSARCEERWSFSGDQRSISIIHNPWIMDN